MPRKKKSEDVSKAAEPKIPKELPDQLITGPITQSEFETSSPIARSVPPH